MGFELKKVIVIFFFNLHDKELKCLPDQNNLIVFIHTAKRTGTVITVTSTHRYVVQTESSE